MKLHLGCGSVRIPGYVNVDYLLRSSVDVIADVRSLPFRASSCDTIYMCSMLEHLGRREWIPVLGQCYDLLRPGGEIYISVPDFEVAVVRYFETGDLSELLGLLIGGQKDECDRHGMLFDLYVLVAGLFAVGFEEWHPYDWQHFIVGELGIDDYSQAYLPHMDKENGTLMMLNIKAVKR